jgi:hypothetical protein
MLISRPYADLNCAFRSYRRPIGIGGLINIGKVAALRCFRQFGLRKCEAQLSPNDNQSADCRHASGRQRC